MLDELTPNPTIDEQVYARLRQAIKLPRENGARRFGDHFSAMVVQVAYHHGRALLPWQEAQYC